MDVHSRETRSFNMSRVRGKDTKPELVVRKICHGLGFRYRLHNKKLPGKPDLAFRKHKAVIFVNGCFWHGHDCHLFKVPKTRTDFWVNKIDGNVVRDSSNIDELRSCGWRAMIVWECALKGRTRLDLDDVIATIERWIPSDSPFCEIEGQNSVSATQDAS